MKEILLIELQGTKKLMNYYNLLKWTLHKRDYLEWIPFEKFEMIKYIVNLVVYSALWLEGPKWIWNDGAQEWTRSDQHMLLLNVFIIHRILQVHTWIKVLYIK
jgi:hypothetical protein